MNTSSLAIACSLAIASTLVVGCSAGPSSSSTVPASSDVTLGSSEEALRGANDDSEDAESNAESAIENGLGGATASEPGAAGDATDLAGLDAKIRTNPGQYFQPAGCIVTTRLGLGQFSHVFTNCIGPEGKAIYNGTVKSTWSLANGGGFLVKHEAQGFSIKGERVAATLSGARNVTYTRSGSVITKHRVGAWSGSLAKVADPSKSVPWTHDADFTSTYDVQSKCMTRDGSAKNTVGDTSFGRTVSGFKVCGSRAACPSSGELELDRKDGAVKVTITFLGGQDVEITGPRGNTVERRLTCIAQ